MKNSFWSSKTISPSWDKGSQQVLGEGKKGRRLLRPKGLHIRNGGGGSGSRAHGVKGRTFAPDLTFPPTSSKDEDAPKTEILNSDMEEIGRTFRRGRAAELSECRKEHGPPNGPRQFRSVNSLERENKTDGEKEVPRG